MVDPSLTSVDGAHAQKDGPSRSHRLPSLPLGPSSTPTPFAVNGVGCGCSISSS